MTKIAGMKGKVRIIKKKGDTYKFFSEKSRNFEKIVVLMTKQVREIMSEVL